MAWRGVVLNVCSRTMTSRGFLRILVAVGVSLLAAPVVLAAGLPDGEKKKIEFLISHLESIKDAKFTRNGTEYDSKSAAKFLRGKWNAKKDAILTAKDFIAKAATKSSTTGKPYLIRLKPGAPQVPCADYLNERLKEFEAAPKTE